MATGKNSFVLYCDIIHTVRKLPKEKVAELFLTILAYVNDENPKVDDPLVDIVFEPIKQQLKRDLKKWDKKRKKLSDAGKASANKRQQMSTNVEQPEQMSTVNVSATVNDTVTDNVNGTVILYRIEECLQISLNDERWVKANKTSRDELEVFNGYLEQVSEYTKNPKDYKSHFARFKRKYPEKVKAESKPISIEEFRRLAKEQDKTSTV